MSAGSAKAYLLTYKPPFIDSAEDFGARFRLANRSAQDLLRACGYEYEETPAGKRWVWHETQLDRVENMLKELLTYVKGWNAGVEAAS